ncbi:MAG: hypothetical protein WC495_05715 [Patescibacteria group bacterium]|jgi:UDP-N-acetylmuramyl pentapeptide phosphotransferase/UDP-N-acetylglucosamine-1-phosphate transferase
MQVPEFEKSHSRRGVGLMIGVVIVLVLIAGVVIYSIVIGR